MNKPIVNIFLADDDEDDIMLFEEAVRQTHIQPALTIFRQGKEVCEYIQDSILIPDIIFLDINMPLMSGVDCLIALRKDERFTNVPIIMYSTSASDHDIENTYNSGANLYIQKANTFVNLQAMLKRVLLMLAEGKLLKLNRDRYIFKYESIAKDA